MPREKYPLGQTVVKPNEQRELTGLFTRQYLEEQLLTTLAGRAGKCWRALGLQARPRGWGVARPLEHARLPAAPAAEEMLYGRDDMTTLHQQRLVLARRIAQKLVTSDAMADNAVIGPRALSTPRR